MRIKTNELTSTERIEKALDLIEKYGMIAGDHHKQWVIAELVNILVDDYPDWVRDYRNGKNGRNTYEWDEGISP